MIAIGRTIEDPLELSGNGNASDECISPDITKQGRESLHYLSSLTASLVADATKEKGDMQILRDEISSTLLDRIGLKRFMHHTPQSLSLNYQRVLDLFTRSRPFRQKAVQNEENINEIIGPGLAFSESAARTIISYLPELCLYDFHELEERIRFMLAPLPPTDIVSSLNDAPSSKRKRPGRPPAGSSTNKMEIDWAKLSWDGYGAGLTVEQATEAVRTVPNILSLRLTDSKKPNVLYYMQELQVSADLSILAENNLEKYLLGTEASDVWAYAYLNKIGLQWNQLRVLLDAFPTLTCIATDVDWRLSNRGIRKDKLDEYALIFLRKRLQIRAMDVFTMLKTHPRLSYYRTSNLMKKFDVYQEKLGLSSRELRKVVLRMPSMLGMSVRCDKSDIKSALDERLDFFFDEVGMTQMELKQALLKQPSILQYSIESLRSKLHFLHDELFISRPLLSRIITTAPAVLGLSLAENIRPKVATLMIRCRLEPEEIGLITATVPSILVLSTKRKIEPCLSYLSVALRLPDEASLGRIVKGAPRVLTQSIDASLEPKIRLMDDALKQERREMNSSSDDEQVKVMDLCVENPALLATTNTILARRIRSCQNNSDATLREVLRPASKGRKQKFEIVRGRVRAVGEGSLEECQEEGLTGVEGYGNTRDMADAIASLLSSGPSLSDLASANIRNATSLSITAFVSGHVFPPDTAGNVRGINQVGGMAIQIAQRLSGRQLQIAAESSTTAVISEKEEPGSNFERGLILLQFPHLQPSRRRCDLCSCELALKIILNFLQESASSYDLSQFNVRVEICSDSSYVYKIVKDRANLLRWGSYSSIDDFVYGAGPTYLANPDILYPLSQYVVDLTTCQTRGSSGVPPVCIGKSVQVTFKHVSEVCSGRVSELTTRQMNEYARQAAMWAYDKDRKKGVGV